MSTKKTTAQLKQTARGMMIGKYRNAISILLASELMINTLSLFTATSPSSILGMVIGFAISFILLLLGTILSVGQCSFYLNIACNQHYEFNNLFTGFKVHPDKTITTQIIIQLLTSLPLLPALLVMVLAFYMDEMIVIFTLGCFLLIIGAALSWWISLRFSQVYYLLLDFPDSSAIQLLKMSWRLMKGNVGRLFYMQISFLPMQLAGLISFGLGLLFVLPYQNMTYTLFYLDLVSDS